MAMPPDFYAVFGRFALGQHRILASARFGGYVPPSLRFEKIEIHTGFLHFSNLDLAKDLSPDLLAELRGAALEF